MQNQEAWLDQPLFSNPVIITAAFMFVLLIIPLALSFYASRLNNPEAFYEQIFNRPIAPGETIACSVLDSFNDVVLRLDCTRVEPWLRIVKAKLLGNRSLHDLKDLTAGQYVALETGEQDSHGHIRGQLIAARKTLAHVLLLEDCGADGCI